MQQTAAEHVLLTALGVRAVDTPYVLGGRRVNASLTPVALMHLLPEQDRPNRAVAVVTAEAANTTWDGFQREMEKLKVKVAKVLVPDGRTPGEVRQIIDEVAAQIPPGCDLTLDITQGFRHFPFVMYALVLYLTSLREVRLRGAYYGMLEGFSPRDKSPRPIVDLRSLLELPQWFYAVRVFRDLGLAAPLAALILDLEQDVRSRARREDNSRLHREASELCHAANALQSFSFAYGAGLPLELGRAAKVVVENIDRMAHTEPAQRLPLASSLAELIREAAERFAFPRDIPPTGEWKTRIKLDDDELERQARIIECYLNRSQIALAVGLMREWVISWIMLRDGRPDDWLSRKAREDCGKRLHELVDRPERPSRGIERTPWQREFGVFWQKLTDELRNALHHHGMRKEAMMKPPDDLEEVREFWSSLRARKRCGPGLLEPGPRPT